nr:ABC transporter substrate-binding protein [uncultured Anaerocolumna sp.]
MRKRKVLAVLMTSVLVLSATGCAKRTEEVKTEQETTQGAEVTATPESTTGETGTYNISVIIKATDSDYWQTLLLGAKAAAEESNGKVIVTTAGPASETGISEQVTILENVVSAKPDGIVLASISSDATVPAVEDAVNAGIPVVTVDNRLSTDVYTQHLATNHYKAAASAAEDMVKQWEAKGIDPVGKKVVAISADSGSPVNQARVEGFLDKIRELVPDIQVIETQYCDNDISKALDAVDNLILANSDLIGIFGDNNHMGDGIANSIQQNEKQDGIISYAFDSDDTEIAAIRDGYLTGIVVQDPYGMGYEGVLAVVSALEGKNIEHDVIAATTLVTKDNIENENVQSLLYPGK